MSPMWSIYVSFVIPKDLPFMEGREALRNYQDFVNNSAQHWGELKHVTKQLHILLQNIKVVNKHK